MNNLVQFITAGNALFTLENTATGNRFTFRVRQPGDDKPHFVSVLTGADNLADGRTIDIRKPSQPDDEQKRVYQVLDIDWKSDFPTRETEIPA